ncbi:MAG: DUF4976 domain-containing protein, partial [Bacteroidales bacterium]|nr:DUF4976 domain-containing protein [Bacteroidales bacterium]
AGVTVPETYQGASMVPLVEHHKTDTWRKSFMCEHRMDNEKIPKYVGVRGERYVYANYYEQEPPYEFLHDLKKDPDQLVNFVNDPDYQDILENMRNECKSFEESIK